MDGKVGFWKRLKYAIFPTMSLKKAKEGSRLSLDTRALSKKATSCRFDGGALLLSLPAHWQQPG